MDPRTDGATHRDHVPTPSPWGDGVGTAASLLLGGRSVTLIEGSTFCISDTSGDITQHHPHGLFVLDTRVLSRWELHVSGARLESLAVSSATPYDATFAGRVRQRGHRAESDLVVLRRRHVGDGMRERLEVRNYGDRPARCTIEVHVDADFADVFEVKESRVSRRGHHTLTSDTDRIVFERELDGQVRTATLSLSQPATVEPGRLSWHLEVPAKGSTELCIELSLAIDGRGRAPRFRCEGDDSEGTAPGHHLEWSESTPSFRSDNASLQRCVERSFDDLGALRIFDPDHPDDPVVAAGAPWFMTLFGRDAVLSSWMALMVDPNLARGVATTLARLQGSVVDDATEEEPGRILHEVRLDRATTLALGGGSVYYGTADATPLFVMLVGELHKWGLPDEELGRLLPHVERALGWIDDYGDLDGDGYVEYRRRTPDGLANQGWKDSWDGISFADGRLAEAPIALCEVQGYTYAAFRAAAHFALEAGDRIGFERHRDRADRLKQAFNRDFWLPDRGWFAVGLDADKAPIDSLTSNIGHCLWTGIVDDDKAAAVAEHLLSPELFSGWGIRTLATTMGRFNPVSYHNGSVWPHDTAICVAGLTRYGFLEHAHRVTEGLLDAAEEFDGRLPELFAGFDRDDLGTPAAYPASCSPQAWAAATPLSLLRSMLRLDPWISRARLHLAPSPPTSVGRIELHRVRVGGRSLDITWTEGVTSVEGLAGLEVLPYARPSLHRPDEGR